LSSSLTCQTQTHTNGAGERGNVKGAVQLAGQEADSFGRERAESGGSHLSPGEKVILPAFCSLYADFFCIHSFSRMSFFSVLRLLFWGFLRFQGIFSAAPLI